MNGFKTIIWNVILVAGGAVLPYLAGVDWTQYVSPTAGVIIVAVVNLALRVFTTTPMFNPK